MLMYGTNIQSAADQLQKVGEDQLFHSLACPKPEVASAMRQLRIVYAMDARRYAMLKRQLPYVVCGAFNPPFRRTENFAFTERFIIDFDHLTAKGLALDCLRERVTADSRVMMCFASPSEDGLKVMFRLKERCYDSGEYSLFYKAFASDFARQMGLEQVLDARTSDVARACFVSVDPKAYFNTEADPVDLRAFVDTADPLAAFDLKHEQIKEEKAAKADARSHPDPSRLPDPTLDTMAQIRATLRPQAPAIRKEVIVPQQLNDIIGSVVEKIQATGIIVTEVTNIQYAKKIHVQLGTRQGEVNLFYGKRGYSTVVSPKRGTDEELNALLADIINAALADQSQLPY